MKIWLQKTLIVTVALLTFGAISPNHHVWNHLQEKNEQKADGQSHSANHIDFEIASPYFEKEEEIDEEELLIASARELSYMKFGTKIGPVISNEFDEVIFPKIEEAIQLVFASTNDVHKQRLGISERPAGNYSEKIFHVYDMNTRKDVIRFHVRTEKRPLDGYFFNFHYHTAEDHFAAHHTIGDIYYSKNTPPKWLS